MIWVDFCFCGWAIFSSAAAGAEDCAEIGGGDFAELFCLRFFDSHERGVAELGAAGLDHEHGGQGEFDVLEPAFFEFAFDGDAAVGLLDVEDEGGVRQAHELGHDDTGLAVAEIVRLEAGEDEVGVFLFCSGSEELGNAERVELVQVVALDLDGAICAFGEGFANGGAGALGSGAENDDFAAVLLLQLQGFFEGVGVRLVHGELEVGFFDPFAGAGDANLSIALGDLFDADDNFHSG